MLKGDGVKAEREASFNFNLTENLKQSRLERVVLSHGLQAPKGYGPIWAHIGPIWVDFGSFWVHMGPIWAQMGIRTQKNKMLY